MVCQPFANLDANMAQYLGFQSGLNVQQWGREYFNHSFSLLPWACPHPRGADIVQILGSLSIDHLAPTLIFTCSSLVVEGPALLQSREAHILQGEPTLYLDGPGDSGKTV